MGARLLLTVPAIALALIIAATAPILSGRPVVWALLVAALFASALNYRWLLQARESFRRIALAEFAGAVIQLLVLVAVSTRTTLAAESAVAIMLAPQFAIGLAAMALLRNVGGLVPRLDPHNLALVRKALPLGLAAFTVAVYYNADSFLLGLLRTSRELGWYGAAYRIVLAFLSIAVIAHSVAVPTLARLRRDGDADRAVGAMTSLSRVLLFISLPLAAGTTLMSSQLVVAIYGAEFQPSDVSLAILIWSLVTVSANVPFAAWLLASGDDRWYLLATATGAVANVLANLVAIPLYGSPGAAATTIASEIIVLTLIVGRTHGIAVPVVAGALRRAALPTIAMVGVMFPLREHLVAIGVGIVTFLAVATLTRSWSEILLERGSGPVSRAPTA